LHYILDSSVIVKWFNSDKEDCVDQAIKLMDLYEDNEIEITIPELAFYEIANALRYNKNFLSSDVKKVITNLLDMQFNAITVETEMMDLAIEIAFEDNISVYDAIFLSISSYLMIPLITANPRHHKHLERGNIILLKDIKI